MEIKKNRIVATPRSKYHKYLFGGSSGSSSGGSISIDTSNFVKKTGETSQTVEGDFVATGSIVAKYMAESYVPDFPIAGNSVLGLIKVGANLSINPDGVLSAVTPESGVSSWNDLTDKPTTLSGYGILATDSLFDSKYSPTNHTHSQYLTGITKSQIEAQLTGNITTHTHSQYLTSYVNNYVTGVSGSGNGTITFTRNGLSDLTFNSSHTHSYLALTGGTLSGSLTATSFIKSGGTSSQFLKADGSVDTNAYLTGISSFVQNNLTYSTSNTTQALSAYQGYLLNRNDITAASLTASTLTLTRASGNITATVPTWNQSTTGNAATATTATNLSGGYVSATTGVFSSTLSVTGAATFGNNIIANGAIVAKYLNSTYITDWPIMSASLQGTAIAGPSLIMTGSTVNIRNRHYTTTSTYTDGKARSITAEISIGTGTMVNTESISITLSFLPVTISYGVVATLIANSSNWTGVGMKVSLVKGGTYWIAFVTNDLGVTVAKDGIYLSISAKQTV